jgi:hypothetical protein
MEFWDALEDSQYLDAVASVHAGPRPICRWEIPTPEQLQEWETKVQARKDKKSKEKQEDEDDCMVPLSLDWYTSCPIGFFFFSTFVKTLSQERQQMREKDAKNNHPNSVAATAQATPEATSENANKNKINGIPGKNEGDNNTLDTKNTIHNPKMKQEELSDQYASVRMNFLEHLLRFQKLIQTGDKRYKPLKTAKLLLSYLQLPEINPETGQLVLPKLSHIREVDLHLPRQKTSRAKLGGVTLVQLEASLALNRDEEYQSNVVGLKGPLLEALVAELRNWMDRNTTAPSQLKKADSEPDLLHHDDDPDPEFDSDGSEAEEEFDPFSEKSHTNTKRAARNAAVSISFSQGDTHRTKIAERLHSHHHGTSSSKSTNPAMHSILEKAEAFIYESLKRDYGAAFQKDTNPLYVRMKNFLWYQDRRVVYDDFYLMRVLGRGGFGLVSGTLLSTILWCNDVFK